MPDLQGQLQSSIGHAYTIERELGAGGMGTVYLARDRKHDRDVATDLTPGVGANSSPFAFDVAPDGRIILAEEVRGSFDLVLVRSGLTKLGQAGGK